MALESTPLRSSSVREPELVAAPHNRLLVYRVREGLFLGLKYDFLLAEGMKNLVLLSPCCQDPVVHHHIGRERLRVCDFCKRDCGAVSITEVELTASQPALEEWLGRHCDPLEAIVESCELSAFFLAQGKEWAGEGSGFRKAEVRALGRRP